MRRDERFRRLERRALSGDRDALLEFYRYYDRIGQIPTKFIIHGWEYAQENLEYPELDFQVEFEDGEFYSIYIEGEELEEEVTVEEFREEFKVCQICTFDISKGCCHCSQERLENFYYCHHCYRALCITDPCVLCSRLDYEEFPNSVGNKIIQWETTPGETCGMCATSMKAEGESTPYTAFVLNEGETFRCQSCGLNAHI